MAVEARGCDDSRHKELVLQTGVMVPPGSKVKGDIVPIALQGARDAALRRSIYEQLLDAIATHSVAPMRNFSLYCAREIIHCIGDATGRIK